MSQANFDEGIPGVDFPEIFAEKRSRQASFDGLSRRHFLKLGGLAGGGLVLGLALSRPSQAMAAESGPGVGDGSTFAPNPFLQITAEGAIILYATNPEVGQGIKTTLPMILAEELDVPWERIEVQQSAIGKTFGRQVAGGSRSVPDRWGGLRAAGATAKAMLLSAAAKEWRVKESECVAQGGYILHPKSAQKASYAELASLAASLPVPTPDSLKLKSRGEYTLLGKRIGGVDNHALVTGQPIFGIDQKLPGMLYAVYLKNPSHIGEVEFVDLDAAKALPGVKDAFQLEGSGDISALAPGVAIIAESTWAAFEAAKAIDVRWDRSKNTESWSGFVAQAEARKGDPEAVVMEAGDLETAYAEASQTVEATYVYPFLSHATLEPHNCTAWFHDGQMEIWAPSQTPQAVGPLVAGVLGLDEADVVTHQLRIGGGFGRRLLNDFAAEAAAIAHRVKAPIKLVATREMDTAHDFYRVGGIHHLKGAVDEKGQLSAFEDHFFTFTADPEKRRQVRGGRMAGDLFPFPMVPNRRLAETKFDLHTPCGWWRAPGSCSLAWVVQSYLHELSVAAGRDHLDFLLELMGEPRWLKEGRANSLNTGRAAAVIRKAAEESGWGSPLAEGKGRGLAFYFSHAGHFAEVAEVSVDASKKVRVERVVVAGDVGLMLNPSAGENQIEGSVIDGLSAMAAQSLTIENGAVQEGNFDRYPLLRMSAAPKVEIHMIESDFPPTGLGEPAFPPLAPAVCNAIFDAMGTRIRQLPLSAQGFSV